ncbi:hypothetical protein N431DRAFT_483323 [Stipitochalara longipes BDJ]|nr:hypothetical protein N431DRAFT_483323 [Stipitochalara longipes BDJ]
MSIPKNLNSVDAVTQDIMHYAYLVETGRDRSEWAVLDELDRFHAINLRSAVIPRARKHREFDDWEEVVQDSLGAEFLKWAVEAQLIIYVERKLREDPTLMLDELSRPLLSHASRIHLWFRDSGINYAFTGPEMVRLLLSFGADPCQPSGIATWTVWEQFLRDSKLSLLKHLSDIQRYHIYKATVMLLDAGADPAPICSIQRSGGSLSLVSLKEPWNSLSATQCRALEHAAAQAASRQQT